MAPQLLPYDARHYNRLPELATAQALFNGSNAAEILKSDIANLFLEYNVHKTLTAVLLHNHFEIEANEMLVSVGTSAVPWSVESGSLELQNVEPCAWYFVDGDLVPYEFEYGATKLDLGDETFQPFTQALQGLLKQRGLDGFLGIRAVNGRTIDGPVTMEFTSGKTNITLPFDIAPGEGGAIDAEWQFYADANGGPMPVVYAQCKNRCKGKPHTGRHVST